MPKLGDNCRKAPLSTEQVTLYHGDCLEVLRTLPGESVDLVIADPPYGARRPPQHSKRGAFDEVENNDAPLLNWLPLTYQVLKDTGAAYVFVCWNRLELWRQAMLDVGFLVRSCIVWDKGIHGLGDLVTCWAPRHEMILFGAKGRHELRSPRPIDIISAQRVNAEDLRHPYQKPTSVVQPLIAASSDVGDVVLDPFMGSGTTGVACMQSGRRFIGIELEKHYYELAQERINEEIKWKSWGA